MTNCFGGASILGASHVLQNNVCNFMPAHYCCYHIISMTYSSSYPLLYDLCKPEAFLSPTIGDWIELSQDSVQCPCVLLHHVVSPSITKLFFVHGTFSYYIFYVLTFTGWFFANNANLKNFVFLWCMLVHSVLYLQRSITKFYSWCSFCCNFSKLLLQYLCTIFLS